nr:MAG TPA_asm: hypothetical protein [Caudoviricetes sp.]
MSLLARLAEYCHTARQALLVLGSHTGSGLTSLLFTFALACLGVMVSITCPSVKKSPCQ